MIRFLTKYYFPKSEFLNKKGYDDKNLSDFYSSRILEANLKSTNKTINEIELYAKNKNLDKNLFKALYYVECYYRPSWFVNIEYTLYKTRILKNPSIGPFQIRADNLQNKGNIHLMQDSLNYIEQLLYSCRLSHDFAKKNFLKLGLKYNLDELYGEVVYKIWLKLSNKS